MVGKYLEENCLYVTDPTAVDTLRHLLENECEAPSPEVKYNKTSQERAAFLKRINEKK